MSYKRSALMEERLAENRGRILKAARRLVAQGGFREAQISAVAEVAGLSTGAIYRYFPSKAELFIEVLTAAVRHEIEILRAIAAEPRPAAQRLAAAVESFARRALEGPNLAYAFIAEPVDPEVDTARIRVRREFGAVFESILEDGMAGGEFFVRDVGVAAACIVGAFTEALVRPTGPARPAADEKRAGLLVKAISDFCVQAVLPDQAGGGAAARKPARRRKGR